ncbi:HNH endonuclease signature motif containing protein [Rhodococcus ruber]|uniref:HNH nuclease domain-containing protein n=2 Tax=Nocardiaceae TaxID=85025 RepID=A0A098BVL3_9NOCA|nr:hypothetical protein RHRU231_930149 [Rhodococcus ruber]
MSDQIEVLCSAEGCDRPRKSKGLCNMHYLRKYQRTRRHPNPPVGVHIRSLRLFWQKVDTSGDCWIWTGPLNERGYGRTEFRGKKHQAHRVAYETAFGVSIPAGHEIDHLCRNRTCVNPWHLEPVTHRENVIRSTSLKTHCVNGHPLSGSNLMHNSVSGNRCCRTCQLAASRRYKARKRAEETSHAHS